MYYKDPNQFLKSLSYTVLIIYCTPTFYWHLRNFMKGSREPRIHEYFSQRTSPQQNLAYLQVKHTIQINFTFVIIFLNQFNIFSKQKPAVRCELQPFLRCEPGSTDRIPHCPLQRDPQAGIQKHQNPSPLERIGNVVLQLFSNI